MMLNTRFGWTLLLVVLALLGTSWIAFSQEDTLTPDSSAGLTEGPIVGYLAPQFTLQSTLGESYALDELRGQPVVLNFWASWCPPCRAEVPHIQASSVKYEGRTVVLGIDQGEPLPIVADFGAVMGVTYPLLLDEDSAVNRTYNVRALPQTVFVDSLGRIREVYTGLLNQAVLDDRIERLLADE